LIVAALDISPHLIQLYFETVVLQRYVLCGRQQPDLVLQIGDVVGGGVELQFGC
jgi:hypothetical protein